MSTMDDRRDYFRSLPREVRAEFLRSAQEGFAKPLSRQSKRQAVRRAWRLAEMASEEETAKIYAGTENAYTEDVELLEEVTEEVMPQIPEQRQDNFEDRLRIALGDKPSQRGYR